MRAKLEERKWTRGKLDSDSDSDQMKDLMLRGRGSIGKSGLINLGNTCYMNSFLQALFMTDYFRDYLFTLNVNTKLYTQHRYLSGTSEKRGTSSTNVNTMMVNGIQYVFGFLMLTSRRAYAPTK